MASNFDQRGMPAGLSLTGQRVLMEVRNSWMKNNPERALAMRARHPVPETQSRSNSNRIPSWNTQIANMPTQDLFNTKHINRHEDFNPTCGRESYQRINYDVLRAQQQSFHYNPTQSTQHLHHSEVTPKSFQPISGGTAQKSYTCTQKSIMLFEDDDDNDQGNSPMIVSENGFRSININNLESVEDEDMFRSVNIESNSPPIELETQPNTPPFIFQPVVGKTKGIENNNLSEASDTWMFKVPQASSVARVYGGAKSSRLPSPCDQWLNGAHQSLADDVSEPVYLLTRNVREQERKFTPADYRFQCDNRYNSSRNNTESGYASNSTDESEAFMSASRTESNEDHANEKCFSQRSGFDFEEFPTDHKTESNRISEKYKDQINELPVSECLQHSPIATNRVDMKFISELLCKLNSVAKENARQEEDELALTSRVDKNGPTGNFNLETTISEAPVIPSKQEKPLPNFYVFKTPLKRSLCDSVSSKKMQKLDLPSHGKCVGNRLINDKKPIRGHSTENLRRKDNHNVSTVDLNVAEQEGICRDNNVLQSLDPNIAKKKKIEDSSVQKQVITNLAEKNLHQIESQLSACKLEEVVLTIMYKEGVTQLDAAQGVALVPSGLLLGIQTAGLMQYYFLRDLQTPWMPATTITNFLLLLFKRECPNICVDVQAMFMYLVDKYSFTQEQVCDCRWMFVDPLVGGWLLDPDHPPSDFLSLAASILGKESCSNSGGRDERGCRLLELLSRTASAVVAKLQQARLYSVFTGLEMKLVPILAVMELRGIAVDIGRLRQMQAILERRLSEVSAQAYRAAGRKFSLNSPVQLRALLYDELHLDKGLHIKSTAALGAKSTAEPMLLLLAPLHPLPALVLRYRQLHKIKAAYVDGILEHSNDGAIFTSWEQTSCATGRITSNSPNVQTIPRVPLSLYAENEIDKTEGPNAQGSLNLRSVFVPRSGFTLVSADFCQVELRLFAHFAQDQTLLDAFRQPGDIFQHLAMLWLGPGENDEDQARQREKTKRVVYSVMYGAGAIKLSEFLQVSQQQASAIIDSFLSLVPALRRFPQQVVERCRQRGYLRSLSGRLRKFPQINSAQLALRKHSERQAVNFLIQGSAADVCKAAMLATEQCLQENPQCGARLLLQIHDELVWEVPCDNVQSFKELISATLDDTNAFCGKLGSLSVNLPIAVYAGDSWGNMS